jgi:cytochrome c553
MTRSRTGLSAAMVMLSWIAVPSAPLAAEASSGKQKAGMCAVCHGIDGIAKQPDAANLAGESVIYLTRQLEAFRSGERKHEQMSIIAQGLSDEDIADLSSWYSSLKVTVTIPQ